MERALQARAAAPRCGWGAPRPADGGGGRARVPSFDIYRDEGEEALQAEDGDGDAAGGGERKPIRLQLAGPSVQESKDIESSGATPARSPTASHHHTRRRRRHRWRGTAAAAVSKPAGSSSSRRSAACDGGGGSGGEGC